MAEQAWGAVSAIMRDHVAHILEVAEAEAVRRSRDNTWTDYGQRMFRQEARALRAAIVELSK